MSVKPRKSKRFSMEETCTLLDIWSDNSIQTKFLKSYKHDVIWEEIAQIMTNLGINRSKQECCNRVNNLKRQFAKIRKTADYEQLDNNPYWLRFITVESKKARLENAASLENEDGTLDGENVELNDDEFVITDFTESTVAAEQGMGLTSLAPFEDYKESFLPPSPNAVTDNGVRKSRTNVSKRRTVEDDYIKLLLENDKLMLHNQYKRLEHGEELSKSATRFLSAVTTYINNCTNNFDRNSDFNIFPTLVTHVQNSDVQSTASSDHVETSGACATEQVKN